MKKWNNETIDKAVKGRRFKRISDCSHIQIPSITPITWRCDECENEWKARVDNVVHKNSGCPVCAGNIPYTVETLNQRLFHDGRNDLHVKELINGSRRNGKSIQRSGIFVCAKCNNEWKADIHNVVKFHYGCPSCNDNIGTRVKVDGLSFHSKLEYYFWKQYNNKELKFVLLRQQRYLPSRRLSCDFYIPEKRLWVEISGGAMLIQDKYQKTINEKQRIVENKKEQFVVLSTFAEIDRFITTLGEQ